MINLNYISNIRYVYGWLPIKGFIFKGISYQYIRFINNGNKTSEKMSDYYQSHVYYKNVFYKDADFRYCEKSID